MNTVRQPLLVLVILASFSSLPVFAGNNLKKIERQNTASQSEVNQEALAAAYQLYEQHKFADALVACERLVKPGAQDFRPFLLMGLIYRDQGNLKRGSEAIARAIALNPMLKEVYILKAEMDRERSADDEAIATLQKAVEIDPEFAEAYQLLGIVLMKKEMRSEAAAAFRSAIKANPQLLSAYGDLAEMLIEMKDQKGAEEVYKRSIVADPKHMSGRWELGRMLLSQGRLADARAVWDERTSDHEDQIPTFGTLLVRAEKVQKAKTDLAQKPDDPETIVEMGLAIMDGESWVVDRRQDHALVYFRRALALKPGFTKAQIAICRAYVQLADTFPKFKITLNAEIAKLRRLDSNAADEIEKYRKSYTGEITSAVPSSTNQ